MPDAWVEARRVARELSRTGIEDAFHDQNNYLNDFYRRVNAYLDSVNVDRRAKASGPDLSFLVYQIAESSNDSWSEMLWSYEMDLRIWEDLARPIPSGDEPFKILTHLVSPTLPTIPGLNGTDRKYTFINTTELFCLEEFFFNHPDSQQFGSFDYECIDQQDILTGEHDGSFDFVRVWSWLVVRPTTTLLEKYMDSVKVGGFFVVNDASNLNQIYDDSTKAHYSPYFNMGKVIADDDRFMTYHLPMNIGAIVARRVR
jgi:hypothetical protein